MGAAATGPAAAAAEVALPDGNTASAGDVVLTRRNARDLPISATDYVRNGYRWTVGEVHPDGSLTVRSTRHHSGSGAGAAIVRLPAGYVAEHVELGYATTIHAAQGVTADRCRLLADDTLDRQLLYVGTSRGRHTNSINLIVVGDGDPHDQTSPGAVRPATATEVLEAIVARDGSQVSAATRARDADAPGRQLAGAAARYHDALGVAAQVIAGPDLIGRIDDDVTRRHPQLREDPAYGVLRARLVLLHLDGHDPITALDAAMADHELGTARNLAAVLDWRLEQRTDKQRTAKERSEAAANSSHAEDAGPLPWLPGIPPLLARHRDWGPYLRARYDRVTHLRQQVLDDVAAWTPDTSPPWVLALGLDHDHPVVPRLAVWRAVHQVHDQDVRATGELKRPRFSAALMRAAARG